MTRPLSPRTARRLARAIAVCAGVVIGGLAFDRHELAALAAGIVVAIALTLVLHLHRTPKGNRR